MSTAADPLPKDPERRAALFESIIESMGESVLVVDREGREVYGNKELRRFRGEVPAGDNLDEWRQPERMRIFDAEDRELTFEDWPVARALRGDYKDNFEIRVRGMAHTPEDVRLSISTRSLTDGAGQIIGAIIVTRDITAMRQTEDKLRQSQKLETIGQLTGGIAHDFNNMLAAILSSAEVIKKGVAGNPKLDQAASTVEKAALRGAELTRHLLAFARKQTLQPAAVDIDALLKETLLLLRPALGETIEVKLDTIAEPIFALVDPAQLTSALLNLCINARDAMKDGGPLIIRTDRVNVDNDQGVLKRGVYVRIAVADKGCGMSEEVQRRAIEPFFTTKGVGKGSGLGLSMVYGFARQSGGDLQIESRENQGTTISLVLPLTQAPAEKSAPSPAQEPPGKFRILVVDDDELVRDALCMQLNDEGYIAIPATDGHDALAQVDRGLAFDLVLTDMVMPRGIDGAQLAAELRKRQPDVRAILSTGYAEHQTDARDPSLTLLHKPYTAQELFAALRNAMLQRAV